MGLLLGIMAWGGAALMVSADTSTNTPQILVTWKSYSYSPDWYTGRNLPPADSAVSVSMDLIDKGKVVDLSNYDVYWYVGDNLISSGKNNRAVLVRASSQIGDSLSLQVRLPSYKGLVLLKTVDIYTTQPKAVIDIPYPASKKVRLPITVQAWPFFFSIKNSTNLNYDWQINNQPTKSQESPTLLNISAPQGANLPDSLSIRLSINNPLNLNELVSEEKTITL